MNLKLQEQKVLREILTKYKQGLLPGITAGTNITFTPSGCRNVVISSSGGGGGSSYIPPFLKTGGASWSGTGLVYDVTTLEYYFNGDKNTSATQVTLDASDPVNNRLDAIVVDEAGVVSVIKGDASASPISPSVDESHILIQYILVEAGSTQPTIAKEDIYLENVEWTTSTYTTGTATGSIDFDNAVSPKQGVKCISANADARLGARFVRTTSFDPCQYTMLSMWVRFTGSNVATNKSLNVRFENGAGALVANTINLFSFGLQRNLLNVWQLVVIPITSFGALPTSVKGLKIIMAGGTVGQARQWDIDLISLTDNSVPSINEQVFNVLKDGALVGQSSSLNFKGASVNITNDSINNKIDVEVMSSGGALSSITAATAANTINNAAFQQEWKWDSLTSGTGLKLSSNSTGAASNTQTILDISTSGANANLDQSTYGLKIRNTKTGTGGSTANYGLDVSCTGAPVNRNIAINANGRVHISNGILQFETTGGAVYFAENSYGNYIGNYTAPLSNALQIASGANINISAVNDRGVSFGTPGERFYNFATVTGVRSVYLMGAELVAGTYYSFSTGTCGIERNGASLRLSANVTSGAGASYTPNHLLTVYGTNSNVGIGTTTPNASAKLDVSSTTQGFAPPEMTATQASAITTTSRRIIIYVTDTNGTFTSAGLWFWNGTIWKLIIAE